MPWAGFFRSWYVGKLICSQNSLFKTKRKQLVLEIEPWFPHLLHYPVTCGINVGIFISFSLSFICGLNIFTSYSYIDEFQWICLKVRYYIKLLINGILKNVANENNFFFFLWPYIPIPPKGHFSSYVFRNFTVVGSVVIFSS